ncbi:MAG TPA: PepSY domain-containing protein [Azospirillum sp.]
MPPRSSVLAVLAVLTVGCLVAPLGGAWADDDHDRALEALKAGRVLPLERMVEQAKGQFGGEVLDVELEEKAGRFVYELKLMAADGRIMKLYYDAGTGELLRARGRRDHGRDQGGDQDGHR